MGFAYVTGKKEVSVLELSCFCENLPIRVLDKFVSWVGLRRGTESS